MTNNVKITSLYTYKKKKKLWIETPVQLYKVEINNMQYIFSEQKTIRRQNQRT